MTDMHESMTAAQTVERLDYGQPPPRYRVAFPTQTGRVWWVDTAQGVDGALAAAWSHYKERHDPPGMWVEGAEFGAAADPGRWLDFVVGGETTEHRRDLARAAAWAWYDRRLALVLLVEQVAEADGMAAEGIAALSLWPRALAISDSECDDTEAWAEQCGGLPRWLVDSTAEMPEMLRG